METRSKNVISSVEEAATRERILRCQRTDPTENYSRIRSRDRDFFVRKEKPLPFEETRTKIRVSKERQPIFIEIVDWENSSDLSCRKRRAR